MGIFSRGKDKKDKTTLNVEEEIKAQRSKMLTDLSNCIVRFENNPEGEEGTGDRAHFNRALDMLKLSYNAVKDITIQVSETELTYIENISKNIAAINGSMHDPLGATFPDKTYHKGSKYLAVEEIYAIVWNWLHL